MKNKPSHEQLKTMLGMQDSMNKKVHIHWREQGFEWYRAIWIECGELMDHIGYKWWKKQDTDWPQVQLEIIDIWHFGLSDILTQVDTLEQAVSHVFTALENNPVGECTLHEATEKVALSSLASKHFSIADFMSLMTAANMDFDQLYTAYVGKNVLNFFRQDNGYKEGTYRKLWDGREDNEHLHEIVAELDSNSERFGEELYNALSSRYNDTAAAI